MSASVLIASTSPEIRMRLVRLVDCEGADPIVAPDAREAMRLFVLREPDLTLLDIAPSPDSGLQLCRDMKTLQIGHRLAVVVIAPRGTRAAAFAAGCDAFVEDQRDERPLVRSVRRFLTILRRPVRTRAAIAMSR